MGARRLAEPQLRPARRDPGRHGVLRRRLDRHPGRGRPARPRGHRRRCSTPRWPSRPTLVYAAPDQPAAARRRSATSRPGSPSGSSTLLTGGSDAAVFHSYRLVLGEVGRSVAAYAGAGVYLDVALGWVAGDAATCPVALREEGDRPSGYSAPLAALALLADGAHQRHPGAADRQPARRWRSRCSASLGAVALVVNAVVGVQSVPAGLDLGDGGRCCSARARSCSRSGVIAEYVGVAVNMAMGKPLYLITATRRVGPLGRRRRGMSCSRATTWSSAPGAARRGGRARAAPAGHPGATVVGAVGRARRRHGRAGPARGRRRAAGGRRPLAGRLVRGRRRRRHARADWTPSCEVLAGFLGRSVDRLADASAPTGALFLASSAGGVYAGSPDRRRSPSTPRRGPISPYGVAKLADGGPGRRLRRAGTGTAGRRRPDRQPLRPRAGPHQAAGPDLAALPVAPDRGDADRHLRLPGHRCATTCSSTTARPWCWTPSTTRPRQEAGTRRSWPAGRRPPWRPSSGCSSR